MQEINDVVSAEQQALELKQELGALVITDQQTYDKATTALLEASSWVKSATSWFADFVKPSYAAYQAALGKQKAVIDPVKTQIGIIKDAVLRYDREQETLRRQQQAEAEAAERKRVEDEKLADAQQLHDQGAPAEVIDEVLSEPVFTAPVYVPATYAKASGVSMRDNWKAEVTDIDAFIKACAKDKNLRGLLTINQPALNAMAKAQKERLDIAGVRAYNDKVVAARGR